MVNHVMSQAEYDAIINPKPCGDPQGDLTKALEALGFAEIAKREAIRAKYLACAASDDADNACLRAREAVDDAIRHLMVSRHPVLGRVGI